MNVYALPHNTEGGSIKRTTSSVCQLMHSLSLIDPKADLIGVLSVWAGTQTHIYCIYSHTHLNIDTNPFSYTEVSTAFIKIYLL